MTNEDWKFINEILDTLIQMKNLLQSLAERVENLEKKIDSE